MLDGGFCSVFFEGSSYLFLYFRGLAGCPRRLDMGGGLFSYLLEEGSTGVVNSI